VAARRRRGASGPGAHFEGFEDVEEIGAGGFSTVYRAREIGPNRFVALKVLSVADVTPHALESFRRESVALGAVSTHPNIVTLYRQETLPDGRPMLVLELCDGSIGHQLRGGPLPARDALAICVKIGGALETAHRAGMLHRDVKPQNILVTSFGEPALADFGVARLHASAQATVGVFGFTTLHAPPELLEGKTLSAATDVYELASTLYQMLAGKAAFTSFDNENPASVILRILRDPVPPLYGADIHPELSDLLVRAMSKEPHERPQRAAEFCNALRRIESLQGWAPTPYFVGNPDGTSERITAAPEPATPTPPAASAPVAPPAPPRAEPAYEYELPAAPAPATATWSEPAGLEHTVQHERTPWAAPPPGPVPRPPAPPEPRVRRVVVGGIIAFVVTIVAIAMFVLTR
jgi:serine/threonine protein kinase